VCGKWNHTNLASHWPGAVQMVAHPAVTTARIASLLAAITIAAAISTDHPVSAGTPPLGAWHVHLVKSEPANNDTLHTAPAAVKLWFTEDPELAITSVSLGMAMGPSVMPVSVSAVHRDAAPHSPVVADITGKVAPGAYTIAWKTAATDGHAAAGTITFVMAGGR
jgi:copper resistance protein C